MEHTIKRACAALALLAAAAGALGDEPVAAGRQVYVEHCRTCHGGIAEADFPLGPSLAGVMGAKAGTRPGGMHSRATLESRIVWDRDALRRFLSIPRREIPEAMMPDIALEPAQLECLIDYLETLR